VPCPRTQQANLLAYLHNRDVEAVKYFCFCFQLRIKLVACKFASASSFFLQNAFASAKIYPLPHLYPIFNEKCFRLLNKSNTSEFASTFSSFFTVIPLSLPQKFNRFRFHIPASHYPFFILNVKQGCECLLLKYFDLTRPRNRTQVEADGLTTRSRAG